MLQELLTTNRKLKPQFSSVGNLQRGAEDSEAVLKRENAQTKVWAAMRLLSYRLLGSWNHGLLIKLWRAWDGDNGHPSTTFEEVREVCNFAELGAGVWGKNKQDVSSLWEPPSLCCCRLLLNSAPNSPGKNLGGPRVSSGNAGVHCVLSHFLMFPSNAMETQSQSVLGRF